MGDVLRFNFVYEEKSGSLQVAAEKNSGKLMLRCLGFFGQEDTVPDYKWDFLMDEGDWDKLTMILGDYDAYRWGAAYLDESVEDGAVWSLEIHTLGKHTLTEGYAKFPDGFDGFKEEMFSFLRMKRRQIHPGTDDFRYLGLAEQKGSGCPIVFADKAERTFTFYNLFDGYQNDGTYFMKDGDWDILVSIFESEGIFGKFDGFPPANGTGSEDQFSVSVGYRPGTVTQRFCGTEPPWWASFSEKIFDQFRSMFEEGRKPADENFGSF